MTDIATLRLFADMRQARLKLIGLDSPDKRVRARLIEQPEVFKGLVDLLFAVEKLVAGPDESTAFWHPDRKTMTAAEKRQEAA